MEGKPTEDKGTTQWMTINLKTFPNIRLKKKKGFIVVLHGFKQ